MRPLSAEVRETRDLLLGEARHRADIQRAGFERVEAKAGVVLGLVATLGPFVASRPQSSALLAIAMAAFGVCAVCSVMVVRLRPHPELSPDKFIPELWTAPPDAVVSHLLTHYRTNFADNEQLSTTVRGWWWGSVGALAAGSVLSALHVSLGAT